MNFKRLRVIAGLLLLTGAQAAWAIPTIAVEQAVVPASTTSTDITVSHTEAATNTTQAGSFNLTYNTAKLSSNAVAVCAGGLTSPWSCTENITGTIVFASSFVDAGNLPSLTVDFTFDLSGADKPSTNPLTVTNPLYLTGDNEFTNPNVTNGSITIQPPLPDADFVPNAGALDLGSAPQSTTASTIVTIDNVGPSGSLLDASCTITTNPTVFSVTNGSVTDLTSAAAPHEVTVGCNSPLIQTHNGQMTCTHDGDGTTDSSPLVYPLVCVMTAGPTPQYTSSPIAAGGTFAFGNPVKDTADPQISTGISNSGDLDTSLDSAGCTITNNPNSAYAIDAGAGAFALATTDPARTITVSCDTAIAGNHAGGILSCPHNGSNIGTPATYTLNCQVDPVPTYGAVLTPIAPPSIPQNNTPNPVGKLAITNSGDVGSNLSGTCTLNANTGALGFGVGGGTYAINKPGAPNASQDINLVCDSAAQPGNHSATLSCTHNDPNGSSPEAYGVSCTVGQPDPAIYASTPVPSSTIDITNGTPIPAGNDDPTAVLEIRNEALTGDANMLLTCGPVVDVFGSAITSDSDPNGLSVAPGGSVDVTFTCDTATANATAYEATYSCGWESEFVTPLGEMGTDSPQGEVVGLYTVTCEVREGFSEVTPNPADGTPQTKVVAPGGMESFFFTFSETGGEETDARLLSCSLEDGSNFEIVSPQPGDYPVTISHDAPVIVEVKGTDPGGVDSFGDELTCIFEDTDNPEGLGVTYQLTLNVGGDAYFTVMKDFTDGNPGDVTVDLDCNTGLILDQEKIISEDGIGVTFVVSSFDGGDLNCNVTERPVAGYSAEYEADGDSDHTDADDGAPNPGCYWTEVDGGDNNVCYITNDPDFVDVVITKEWLYPGSADGTTINDYFEITMFCIDGEIDGGVETGDFFFGADSTSGLVIQDYCGSKIDMVEGIASAPAEQLWCKTLSGNGNTVFNEQVKPIYYEGGFCVAFETVFDDAIEVDNGCFVEPGVLISAGSGGACTITNTVFYEGIPTLNQYGMALLALLMLGMGFVSVRRII